MTSFFANKGFYPQMTFGPDDTKYETAQERIQAAKAEDITGTIDNSQADEGEYGKVSSHYKTPCRQAPQGDLLLSGRSGILIQQEHHH